MADLSINFAGIAMRNPVVTASGAFGYAKEYSNVVPLNRLGAVTVKGVSPFPSHGNPVPRTTEVYGGMLTNSWLDRELGLAGRIVGESLEDQTRQSGIVDRFLAELEAGNVRPEVVGTAGGPEAGSEGQGS